MSGSAKSSASAAQSIAALHIDSRCTLGEGIVWCERREALLWTDIESSRLWLHHPASALTRSWRLPDRLGSFALCESGKLLLGLAKGLFIADIDASSGDELAVSPLIGVETGEAATRINDGRTDRDDNFVFGTMDDRPKKAPIGSFYQYSTRHGLRRLDLGAVAIPNSICFSPDGKTLYYCDSTLPRIMCCDYDAATAGVANPRIFVALDAASGSPDGSTVDADGCLWNAQWGAARVLRYTADGEVERSVSVAARNPSCVALGGAGLDQLFITTARQDLSPQQLEQAPQSGGVYHLGLSGVRGLTEGRFTE